MTNKFASAGKLVYNQETELVEMVRATDRVFLVFIPTKKKLAWIEETECVVALYYKDTLIKEYNKFSDYYGYGTSKKSAIEEAQEYINEMKIEPQSGLVFKVLQTTSQTPCVLLEEPTAKKRLIGEAITQDQKLYLNNPKKLEEMKQLMEDQANFDEHYDRIEDLRERLQIKPREITKDVVVWDSLKGDYEV